MIYILFYYAILLALCEPLFFVKCQTTKFDRLPEENVSVIEGDRYLLNLPIRFYREKPQPLIEDSGWPLWLIILLGVAAILIVGGVIGLFYYAFTKEPKPEKIKKINSTRSSSLRYNNFSKIYPSASVMADIISNRSALSRVSRPSRLRSVVSTSSKSKTASNSRSSSRRAKPSTLAYSSINPSRGASSSITKASSSYRGGGGGSSSILSANVNSRK